MCVFQCSSHLDYQLPDDQTRLIKLMRRFKSSDLKLLAKISKVETNNELKSDFEAIRACVLPHNPTANNKAY